MSVPLTDPAARIGSCNGTTRVTEHGGPSEIFVRARFRQRAVRQRRSSNSRGVFFLFLPGFQCHATSWWCLVNLPKQAGNLTRRIGSPKGSCAFSFPFFSAEPLDKLSLPSHLIYYCKVSRATAVQAPCIYCQSRKELLSPINPRCPRSNTL